MLSNGDGDIPEWKREILRRRQSKSQSPKQLVESSSVPPDTNPSVIIVSGGQQPGSTCNSSASNAVLVTTKSTTLTCNNKTCASNKMVQERTWTDHKQIKAFKMVSEVEKGDSDSSEELKYGPGIVSRLKNRYLNLTLRENTARSRPSILSMRKAASLENMLDDDDEDYEDSDDASSEKCKYESGDRLFETRMNGNSNGTVKNVPNRYKNTTRRYDMKRARSVEIISSCFEQETVVVTNDSRPKSLHEEMLIKTDGSDKMFEINDNKTFSNNIGLRLNRPKRLQPVMNEKEKPPADVVKQTKKIFERPELRTRPPQQTGEVAAKVATYKTIIVQTKTNNKKPPIKQKPIITKPNEKPIKIKQPNEKVLKLPAKLPNKNVESFDDDSTNRQNSPDIATLPSPNDKIITNESELNGYINSSLTEVPDLILHSSQPNTKITTGDFLKAEIDHSNFIERKNKINKLQRHEALENDYEAEEDQLETKQISPESQRSLSQNGNSIIFNFSSGHVVKNHLPNLSPTNAKVPVHQQLKVDVAFVENTERKHSPVRTENNRFSPKTSPQIPKQASPIQPTSQPPRNKQSPQQITKQSPPQISNQTPQTLKQPSSQMPKQPSQQTPKQPPPQIPKQPSSAQKTSPQIPMQTNQKPQAQISKDHQKINEITQSQLAAQITKPKSLEPVSNSKLPSNSKQSLPEMPKSPPKSIAPQKHMEVNKSGVPCTESEQVGKNVMKSESLNDRVAEKNFINASKSVEKTKVGAQSPQKIEVPRSKKPPRPKQEQNSLVFNFTNRKDVPDYVGNDGRIKTGKIEKPKPGEGGITLMPGATLDESLVDDDEDWLRSLQGPPSPCNVTFINDNILIDGRSSLSQKTKKPKMRIQFIDGADIFEYPSEASLLEDRQVPTSTETSPTNSVGHAIPSLSGSTLANYTPKSSLSEEFELGMKPHAPALSAIAPETKQIEDEEETQPILFSAGTNSDILF